MLGRNGVTGLAKHVRNMVGHDEAVPVAEAEFVERLLPAPCVASAAAFAEVKEEAAV